MASRVDSRRLWNDDHAEPMSADEIDALEILANTPGRLRITNEPIARLVATVRMLERRLLERHCSDCGLTLLGTECEGEVQGTRYIDGTAGRRRTPGYLLRLFRRIVRNAG